LHTLAAQQQAGLALTEIGMRRAARPELRILAGKLHAQDQARLAEIQGLLRTYYGAVDLFPLANAPRIGSSYESNPELAWIDWQTEIDALNQTANPVDALLIERMLFQHQVGLDAAYIALRQASHPEVQQVAQALIRADLDAMQTLFTWVETPHAQPRPAPLGVRT
jgi:uncharacterized protein (DUF305 family)